MGHSLGADQPKEVVEVLPAGYVHEFPGYENVILDFTDLKQLVANPAANRVWHRLLGEVSGIYLIVDRYTGKQYVGSAYGKQGILGRWTQYASTGHGGNQQLKALLAKDPGYANHFQFSILAVLPLTTQKTDAFRMETLFKRKLGSRSFGLNSN